MNLIVVIGAGGTASHFIPQLVSVMELGDKPNDIFIIDGDKVEEKNLLRQRFFNSDLYEFKAQSMVDRYGKNTRKDIRMKAVNRFLDSALDLSVIFEEMVLKMGAKYERVIVVSCVDNNMARLRAIFGCYHLQDKYGVRVDFIDSGNNEFDGQIFATSLLGNRVDTTARTGLRKTKNFLSGVSQAVAVGKDGFVDFKFSKSNITYNAYYNIFTIMNDWKDRLTKGEHEMSCDDVTASNPQNIGTNVMAGMSLGLMLTKILLDDFTSLDFRFNAFTNSFTFGEANNKVQNGYEERLKELVEYVSTEEGFNEIFSPSSFTLFQLGFKDEALSLLTNKSNKVSEVVKENKKVAVTTVKSENTEVVAETKKPNQFLEALKTSTPKRKESDYLDDLDFDIDDIFED